jgi:hypothetical protein
LIFAQKKIENPARIFDPSENSSVLVLTDTCLTCVGFGMCVIRRWSCRWLCRWLWHNPVNVFQLSVKYRWVKVRWWLRRWLWHNLVNFFQLSVKYWRVIVRRWLWHNPVNCFQLSVKYRRVIVCRCTRRWNCQYFLFFVYPLYKILNCKLTAHTTQ